VLKLFAEASGGTVLHEQEDYLVRGRLVNTASWSWQQLAVGKLATVDCWAEVYVENLSSVPVWFDDLEIATGALPVAVVVQETHYDPWGLELAGIGRGSAFYNASGNPEHRWKFNGGVERTSDFGLHWDESGARMYDPQVPRFLGVDPLADQAGQESWTPYHYGFNNPARYNDPDGKCPTCNDIVDFFNGVANAVVSNMTTNGITGQSLWARGQGGTSAYQAGQTMGDAVSVVAGVGEVVIGTVLGTGGVAVSSTGAGVIVGAPAAAAGAAVATHGTLTAANGIKNLLGPKPQTGGDGNGRVYAAPNRGGTGNGGTAKPHGGKAHDAKIDNLQSKVQKDPNNTNFRKNQEQHNVSGNKVGKNKPDLQWDNTKTGKHYNVEYDTKKSSSNKHKQQVTTNDPNAVNKFWMIK
jgi:RHS repeat-associated protein